MNKSELAKARKIFKKYGVLFAYLFGSRAAGTAKKASDYDFAVMLGGKLSTEKKFAARCRIISELAGVLKNNDIDLVVLDDERSVFFRFVIVKEGRLIYNRDVGRRIDFELKAMNEYYDFAPFLEEYNKAFIKRELSAKK